MKVYGENEESLCLQYSNVNNLYGWTILQKLPVNNFECIKDTSQFDKDFKNFNQESDEGYFFEVDVQHPENIHNLHNDVHFLLERMKIEKVKKVVRNLHDETEYALHKKFKTKVKSWIRFEKSS